MNDLEEQLRSRARDAAPGRPAGEHLSRELLEQLRAGGDDDDARFDDAYRHLASCSACRARLADEVATAEPPRNVAPIRRRRAWPAFLAAAAVLVLAAAALLRKPATERLDVHSRTFAGTMGSADAGAIAVEDLNLELSFESTREAAALLVVDRDGKRLAPPRRFTREGSVLRAVVAPRTFAPHSPPAIALIVAGAESAVRATLDEAAQLPAIGETELRAAASRHDAVVEPVTIAQ